MKEYDCNKILDYTHEVQRFCEDHKIQGCDNCPLMKDAGYCSASIFDITQERINFIQKWSDEHRVKTRKEAYLKIFPKLEALKDRVVCFDDHLPCFGDLIGIGGCEEEKTCSECWQEPYNNEFEKAMEEDGE